MADKDGQKGESRVPQPVMECLRKKYDDPEGSRTNKTRTNNQIVEKGVLVDSTPLRLSA
jgi:hypothetical protein